MKAKDTFVIIGKRWFQKTYGNTYHSVKVFYNGEFLGENVYSYGYGDSYLQTAFGIIKSKGFFQGENYFPWAKIDADDSISVVYQVIDVQRKKDL